MADKLRLFFALWPDEAVRQRIMRDAQRAVEGAGARPVPPENYHITLAFLGNISAGTLPEIVDVCRDIRFGRFTLQLDRTGYWPRSQVAWLGPSDYPIALPTLVDDVWDKLESLGLQRDDYQYRPHVTLSRKASAGVGMLLDEPVEWPVSEFTLVVSNPGAAGPVYSVLEHFSAHEA